MDHDERSTEELLEKKKELEEELKRVEDQIHHLETSYLEETWYIGNVVKGFEGFLSNRSRSSTSHMKKSKYKDSDRLFSNSSGNTKIEIPKPEVLLDDETNDLDEILEEKITEKKRKREPSDRKKKKKSLDE